jgi:hypothetical protein
MKNEKAEKRKEDVTPTPIPFHRNQLVRKEIEEKKATWTLPAPFQTFSSARSSCRSLKPNLTQTLLCGL